jgi:hypothetical protein
VREVYRLGAGGGHSKGEEMKSEIGCSLFHGCISNYIASNGRMTDELERIWKEVFLNYLRLIVP